MLENLSSRLNAVVARLRGRGRIDEKDIEEAGRQIRLVLLEADVNYKVVKDFVASVKEKALGEAVLKSLTPGQQVVKVVRDELARVMGGSQAELKLTGQRPDVIVLVGLQGSGKTTAAAKLAHYLKKQGKKPLLISADTYRPAARDQLAALAGELGVDVYPGESGDKPANLAKKAVLAASLHDVVIIDTAGRLHIDKEMMNEAIAIKNAAEPGNILFVADAMTGQDAVKQAEAFNRTVDFDGVILTKLDGDARGGAALSIRAVTGKPIMFVSTGEKAQDFDVFHPDRMASRILNMGDVLSLVEKAEEVADEDEAKILAEKLVSEQFTLEDYLVELDRISKMGDLRDMISMLPAGLMPKGIKDMRIDEKDITRTRAIIQSMTREERVNPKIINGSRRARIAAGSGTSAANVNALLKQFEMMRKMIKTVKKGEKARWQPGLSS